MRNIDDPDGLIQSADRAELVRNVISHLDPDPEAGPLFRFADSLSLTEAGLRAMETEFESWAFPLDRPLTAGEKIALSNGMETPYFLRGKSITVFARRHAAAMRIIGASGRSVREFILAIGEGD